MFTTNKKLFVLLEDPGAAHTFGSNVDLLNNFMSLPVKTKDLIFK